MSKRSKVGFAYWPIAAALGLLAGLYAVLYWQPWPETVSLPALAREASRVKHADAGTRIADGVDRYHEAKNVERVIIGVLGYRMEYWPQVHLDGDAMGETWLDQRLIVVREDLSWNRRLAVLAHEGGHALEPWSLRGADAEVFADAVAYVVTQGPRSAYAAHIAMYKGSIHIIVDFDAEIRWAAAILRGPQ